MKKRVLFLAVICLLFSCKDREGNQPNLYKTTWQSTVVSYNFPQFYLDGFIINSRAESYYVFKIKSFNKGEIAINDFKKIVAKYNDKFIPVAISTIRQDEDGYALSSSLSDSLFIKAVINEGFTIKSDVKSFEDKIFKSCDSVAKGLDFIMIMKNGDSLSIAKSKDFRIKMIRKYSEQEVGKELEKVD